MCSLYETKAKDHDTAVTISSHFLWLCLYSLIFDSMHSHVTDQCASFLKYLQPILSSLKNKYFFKHNMFSIHTNSGFKQTFLSPWLCSYTFIFEFVVSVNENNLIALRV